MKLLSLTLGFSTLLTLASAAPSPNKEYWLQVIGGNKIIHGQKLRFNNTQIPGVTAGPYNPADHFVRVKPDSSIHTIFIVPTNPHPPPVPGYLALIGPSGKGDLGLQATWNPTPVPIGSEIDYKDWRVVTSGKTMYLRYKDDACRSHWIAVPRKVAGGKTRWEPFWYTPSSANIGDFPSFLLIDIQIVEAKPNVNS